MKRRQGKTDRKFRRYDVDGITGSLKFAVEVKILNISAGGMQVETITHLTVGRQYLFKLHYDGQSLSLPGRIAWCGLTGTRRLDDGEVVPTYTAGIAFDDTLTDDGKALLEFIDDTVVIELQRRIFGRFQLEDSGAATAHSKTEFLVQRISQSGMLISTDFVPELESTYSLEVRLGHDVFRCVGRVAHVEEQSGDEADAELGVEFLEVSDEQRRLLADFIDHEFTEEDPTLTEE